MASHETVLSPEQAPRRVVVHINDCHDENARVRLSARTAELIGETAGFAGTTSTLEAGGLLVDVLDALDGAVHGRTPHERPDRVVLVNVAPRSGEAKRHENGTPFCYFRYRGILVVATVDGYTLSFIKKLGLVDSVRVLDTRATLGTLRVAGLLSSEEEARISHTQFRSYEFSPRVAAYLLEHAELPGTDRPLAEIADPPDSVWYVDNFGNCKTTLLAEEVQGNTVTVAGHTIKRYNDLKDIPDGELGVVVGSSATGERRFLEIMLQGGSAARALNLSVGSALR